jgi:hypothetical protein
MSTPFINASKQLYFYSYESYAVMYFSFQKIDASMHGPKYTPERARHSCIVPVQKVDTGQTAFVSYQLEMIVLSKSFFQASGSIHRGSVVDGSDHPVSNKNDRKSWRLYCCLQAITSASYPCMDVHSSNTLCIVNHIKKTLCRQADMIMPCSVQSYFPAEGPFHPTHRYMPTLAPTSSL